MFCVGYKKAGNCLDENGAIQNTGSGTLPTTLTEGDCLAQCRAQAGATGCEYTASTDECVYHTATISMGNGDAGVVCVNFGVTGNPLLTNNKL